MAENIEQILSGICPSCEEESDLKYIGELKHNNNLPIQLYNCKLCGSTINLASFNNKNKNPKASSQ